jgi:hypothetical protein
MPSPILLLQDSEALGNAAEVYPDERQCTREGSACQLRHSTYEGDYQYSALERRRHGAPGVASSERLQERGDRIAFSRWFHKSNGFGVAEIAESATPHHTTVLLDGLDILYSIRSLL